MNSLCADAGKEGTMGKGKKILAASIACMGTGLLLARGIFRRIFARCEKMEDSLCLWYKDMPDIQRKKVTIASGSTRLTGYLYGEESEKGLVVICHGIGGGGEDNLNIAKKMLDDGFRVFTFDYTGVYESEGKSSVGFYQSVKDLDAVLRYIRGIKTKKTPVFLYGHSWGGYTVAAELNQCHDVAGVISISGFDTPMGIAREVSPRMMPAMVSKIVMPFASVYQRIVLGKNYNLSAVDGINSADVPVLIMHGIDDEMIRYDGASIIARKDEIYNPNVEYYTEERKGKSTHSGILFTKKGSEYFMEKHEELEVLKALYYNRVPSEVIRKWISKVDKQHANELDPVFVELVLSFLNRHAEKFQADIACNQEGNPL